jgi:outer membrane murein-binding lipoprotein Lpp
MKRIGLPLLLLLCAVSGCQNEDQMKEQVVDLRSTLESKVSNIGREIDAIKRQLPAATDSEQQVLEGKMDRLEDAREELDDHLDRIDEVEAGEWDEFHRSVLRSIDNAEEVLKNVAQQEPVSPKG